MQVIPDTSFLVNLLLFCMHRTSWHICSDESISLQFTPRLPRSMIMYKPVLFCIKSIHDAIRKAGIFELVLSLKQVQYLRQPIYARKVYFHSYTSYIFILVPHMVLYFF